MSLVAKYEFDSSQQAEKAFTQIKNSIPYGVNLSGRTIEITNECPDVGLVSQICRANGGG